MSISVYFDERKKCPFCGETSDVVINRANYHSTAEANRNLPDIHGSLFNCEGCGVAFPSHMYKLEAFSGFYKKLLQIYNISMRVCCRIFAKYFCEKFFAPDMKSGRPGIFWMLYSCMSSKYHK